MARNREEDRCLSRADELEVERFTLHAQDFSAPTVVVEWIKQNIETAPERKLRDALDCALRMRQYTNRKNAD